jgi:excisionase family DNA binding protein
MQKNNLAVEPLLIDVKTAAKLLNVCERTIRTLTKRGELPVVKILGRVLFSRDALTEFIQHRSKREVCETND